MIITRQGSAVPLISPRLLPPGLSLLLKVCIFCYAACVTFSFTLQVAWGGCCWGGKADGYSLSWPHFHPTPHFCRALEKTGALMKSETSVLVLAQPLARWERRHSWGRVPYLWKWASDPILGCPFQFRGKADSPQMKSHVWCPQSQLFSSQRLNQTVGSSGLLVSKLSPLPSVSDWVYCLLSSSGSQRGPQPQLLA